MRTRNFLWLFVIVGISFSLYYIVWGSGTDKAYITEINKGRQNKDDFMKSSRTSPFKSVEESFKGLQYFPPDPAYRIQADLMPVASREIVQLTTSDGKNQSYLRYAWAEFDMQNLHNRLLILEVMEDGPERGKLFLAFADQTSANETYGAGRYLDVVKVPGAGTITLDFNNAYNPYCAYANEFSCPFPPKENFLKVAIKAGEKNYK